MEQYEFQENLKVGDEGWYYFNGWVVLGKVIRNGEMYQGYDTLIMGWITGIYSPSCVYRKEIFPTLAGAARCHIENGLAEAKRCFDERAKHYSGKLKNLAEIERDGKEPTRKLKGAGSEGYKIK